MIALERELAQDWQNTFYPPGPEMPDEPVRVAQAPVEGAGGAAFGVFPAMRSAASRTGEISPAGRMLPADVAAGALKGTITGGVGLAGDVISIIRGVHNVLTQAGQQDKLDAFLSGLEEKTFLPTSEDVSKWLDANVGPVVPPEAPMAKQRAGVAEVGQVLGELTSGPATLVKGAKATGRAAATIGKALAPKAGEMLGDYMRRAGLTPELMAYHGTPHRFAPEEGAPLGRFSAKKIGAGEGAQAFGYGLYFAESPGVAKHYQTTLTTKQEADLWTDELRAKLPKPITINELDEIGSLRRKMMDGKLPQQQMSRLRELLDRREKYEAEVERLRPKGSFYTVNIPDEMVGKMLDWDEPLAKQSEAIQRLAKQYGLTDPDDLGGDLVSAVGAKRASGAKILRDAGVPGVRYLDQSTRRASKNEVTRNIVVFPGEEDKVKILKVE